MWLMATILDNAGLQQDQCDNLTSDGGEAGENGVSGGPRQRMLVP